MTIRSPVFLCKMEFHNIYKLKQCHNMTWPPYNGLAGNGSLSRRGGVFMGIVVVRSPKCLRRLLRRLFGLK